MALVQYYACLGVPVCYRDGHALGVIEDQVGPAVDRTDIDLKLAG